MIWIKALLLGIIQGVTEFLPVSSSGHLVLFRNWFGLEEAGLTFDVLLHLGTMLAIVVVYWPDLMTLARSLGDFVRGRAEPATRNLLIGLAIGIVPVVVVGLSLRDWIEVAFSSVRFASAMLLVTASILFVSHRFRGATGEVTVRRALFVGLAQVLALLPGISRSGTTISAGMAAGIRSSEAARFSFLMAVPLFLGAAVVELPDLGSTESVIPVGPMALGFLSSFGAGYVAIRWLLRVLAAGRFVVFAIYCAAMGTIGLIVG